MGQQLLAVLASTGHRVQDEGRREDAEQRQRERVLVENEDDAAGANRPGDLIPSIRPAGISVLGRRIGVRVLRLGGASAEKEGRQQHIRAHLQELALPVLEDRFAEARSREVLRQGDRRHRMLDLLAVVVVQPVRTSPTIVTAKMPNIVIASPWSRRNRIASPSHSRMSCRMHTRCPCSTGLGIA